MTKPPRVVETSAAPVPESASKPVDNAYVLTDEQTEAVGRLDTRLPEYKALSNGEVGGLATEALEGYHYGERVRYDTSGKKW